MSRFRINKISLDVYESEFNTKHNYVVDIDDNVTETTKTCTVEEFLGLASLVKTFADEIKAEEKAKLQEHIAVLEERLAANKKLLAQLD